MMQTHPSHAELDQFCRGLLRQERLEEIALHLTACRACAGQVHSLSVSNDALVERLRIMSNRSDASPQDPHPLQSTAIRPEQPHESKAPACSSPLANSSASGLPSDFVMSSNVDRPATHIGRYELRQAVGSGAFGSVYRGWDPTLRLDVAIKVPHSHVVESMARAEACLREARSLAQLRHPGIVSIYNIDQLSDGRWCLVTEFVDGPTMKDLLRSHHHLSPAQAAEIMAAVSDALQHAHQRGFVHRDLKPSNILLDQEGHPRVADFGLALHKDQQRLAKGEVAGTAAYMSPEQLRGEVHQLDGRTDVWSVGVILYELLTGKRPFQGQSAAEIEGQIQRQIELPRQIDDTIPEPLEQIALKCLQKSVTDRYRTARDVERALRSWDRRPTSSTKSQVRLACHVARFFGNPEPALFVNLTNLSQSDVFVVTHIWVEAETEVHIFNKRRPLPKRLDVQETWETWIFLRELDESQSLNFSVRARLSNGEILISEPNVNVPNQGIVPGDFQGHNQS